jgi:hypothetical protein
MSDSTFVGESPAGPAPICGVTAMLLGLVFIACLISVPLARGRLSALGDLQIRRPGLAVAGIAVQVAIISLLPSDFGSAGFHEALHLTSYALLGACAWANRRIPGVPLIVLGGLLNVIAITANGGVMPADPSLVVNAAQHGGEGFVNSGVVEHARLQFLGDVFATPRSWPMANVYSVGDLLIVLGVFVLLHRVSGSRLLAWWPSGRRSSVAADPDAERRARIAARAVARAERTARASRSAARAARASGATGRPSRATEA